LPAVVPADIHRLYAWKLGPGDAPLQPVWFAQNFEFWWS